MHHSVLTIDMEADLQVDSQKWHPRNKRMANLMKEARARAVHEHARAQRGKLHVSRDKPTKALTKRQKSSKRSAEISRAKYGIYIKLLEEENEKETAEVSRLQERLIISKQNASIITTKISRLKNRYLTRQKDQSDVCSMRPFECDRFGKVSNRCIRTGENIMVDSGSYQLRDVMYCEQIPLNKPGSELQKKCRIQKSKSSNAGYIDHHFISEKSSSADGNQERMRLCREKLKISNIINPVSLSLKNDFYLESTNSLNNRKSNTNEDCKRKNNSMQQMRSSPSVKTLQICQGYVVEQKKLSSQHCFTDLEASTTKREARSEAMNSVTSETLSIQVQPDSACQINPRTTICGNFIIAEPEETGSNRVHADSNSDFDCGQPTDDSDESAENAKKQINTDHPVPPSQDIIIKISGLFLSQTGTSCNT